MLPVPFVAIALVCAFGLTAVYSLTRALLRGTWVARINHLLTALMCAALAADAAGWTPGPEPVLIWLFFAVALWFMLQAVLQQQPWVVGAGIGVAGCVYRAALMAVALWILVAGHPGNSGRDLTSILTYVMGAIALAFTCIGWLLATFAAPQRDTSATAVPRVKGIHEALIAAGMALALFAIV